MSEKKNSLDQLCVNTIRTLAMDAVQAAESGHPGMPMGMADAAYVLWTKFLKHDPSHPAWYNRDRFVLSAGHGSMLLYSLLHLTGYDMSLNEIKNFRQWGSKTPGHPEYHYSSGIETTTGPLGQGFATGVGMAMVEEHMAAKFNENEFPVTDHYTYAIASDGDMMEGISHEAASMAGHMKLGKLIYLYDDNEISIDGSTELAFTEDVQKRFNAYQWHTMKIDGHDRKKVEEAIEEAQSVKDKPSLIICRTHIGFGSPNKQDSSEAHGSPLGEEEVAKTKKNLGWDYDEKFFIPDKVLEHFRKAKGRGSTYYDEWQKMFKKYRGKHKTKAKQFDLAIDRKLPDNFDDLLPVFEADEKGEATRKSSGTVLQSLADGVPQLMGGSADLTGSTKTLLDGEGTFSPDNYGARNIHFGVREHAMVAAVSGMVLHSGVIPFGATFLIFSDYCRPAIRIAALSEIPTIIVFTHDSIGLGEDGPTHQPVEHLASLRAMPNLLVLRPADANEVAWCWKAAIEYTDGPSMLALTRQSVPTFERNDKNQASNSLKGAYILADSEKEQPDVILMGTGSEVQLAMDARSKLSKKDIDARVVSMPCWELFREQDDSYKQSVLPKEVKARVSIEAASPFGWEEWVGSQGIAIGLDHYGASAPYKKIFKEFDITSDRMAREAESLLDL